MANKQNEENQMSLTQSMFKNKKDQMNVMKNFRYKFPQLGSSCDQVCLEVRKHVIERQKTINKMDQKIQSSEATTFSRLDNKASVVNGKLVYIDTQQQNIGKDRRELMKLLKQNGISYKQYLLGNKQKFHKQIAERQKVKEKLLIDQYIKQHINKQKTTKIQFADNTSNKLVR